MVFLSNQNTTAYIRDQCCHLQACFHIEKYHWFIGIVSSSGKCEEFVDWTCGLKANGYLSLDECEAKCQPHDHSEDEVEEVINGKSDKCNSPPKPGPCKSRLRRLSFFMSIDSCNRTSEHHLDKSWAYQSWVQML